MPALYKISKDNKARYLLGETVKKNLLVFGVNPSTATDLEPDQTIRLVKGYSSRIGFDGWIMANLYPQRATNPRDLHTINHFNRTYHKCNLGHIAWATKKFNVHSIWCAWGNLIESRSYLKNCLKDIFDLSELKSLKIFSIGLTQKMHPKHPSRMSYGVKPKNFDIKNYLYGN